MNRQRVFLVLKVALAGAVIAILAALLLAGFDVRLLVERGLAAVRGTGPLAFFACMAVLPAIGVPLSVFTLTAMPLFRAHFGVPLVLLLAFAAITVNMGLSYALAGRALRPLLRRVLNRAGYRLPAVGHADATDFILLLRVTPGIPFPVQNYLLGMAGVPFARYLILSALVTLPICAAFLLLGDALLQGRGRMALLGTMLLLAALVAIHFVRRRVRAQQPSVTAADP